MSDTERRHAPSMPNPDTSGVDTSGVDTSGVDTSGVDTSGVDMLSAEEQGSFLSRWSRRKQEAREADADPPASGPSEAPPRELTDEDMPALESLHQDADVSMFFSSRVSPQLRRQALRKLFHTPKFNIRDGLDDFDEDYTYFAPLGDTVTADMRNMKEVAERRARELAEPESTAHRSVRAESSPTGQESTDHALAETPVRQEATDADTLANAEPGRPPESDMSEEERSA